MAIIEKLREVQNLDTSSFSRLNTNFKVLALNEFTYKLNLDMEEYKIKPSVGTGQMADMWWIGIFNRDFYRKAFQSRNESQIGASKGYYIVYLFNKDRSRMYLTLAQASSGISSNVDKLNIMLERNKFFQDTLFPNSKYLKNIHNALSNDDTQKARDYEYAVLLAKEYDLSSNIDDIEFRADINDFILKYEELMNYIYSNPIIVTENFALDARTGISTKKSKRELNIEEYIENEVDQVEIQDSKYYENETDVEKSNNREPLLMTSNHKKYYRDAKLSKTVLVKRQYLCDIDNNHRTFTTNSNHQYSEAHHLIPMKFQKDYPSINLDRDDNIVSLCPICHNALHYGNEKEVLERLIILYDSIYASSKLKDNIVIENYMELFKKFY